jgi:hypothetical protein
MGPLEGLVVMGSMGEWLRGHRLAALAVLDGLARAVRTVASSGGRWAGGQGVLRRDSGSGGRAGIP